MNKLNKLDCRRCGHIWIPRQEVIKICPKCKSVNWNKSKNNNKMMLAVLDGLEGDQLIEKAMKMYDKSNQLGKKEITTYLFYRAKAGGNK